MLYLAIFFVLIIILALVLLLKINIVIEYTRNDEDDHIVLSIFSIGGLLKLKYEIPMADVEKTGIRFIKYKEKGRHEKKVDKSKGTFDFSEMLERIKYFNEIYTQNRTVICSIKKYIQGRITISELKLDILVGTGEAHYTGLLSGLMWSVYGVVLSLISNIIKVLKNDVHIKSDFVNKVFNVDLFCIFTFKLVHIIVIGSKVAFVFLKLKFRNKKSEIGGGVIG